MMQPRNDQTGLSAAGTPDDDTLTQTGLPANGTGRVLLIACGALAREIMALKRAGSWDHVDLTCLPAALHNRPEKITQAVIDCVEKHRSSHDHIFVVYADCGTGGQLKAACNRMGVEMIKGPHCYSFYEGNEVFAGHNESEITAFYLTDFLARQFDTLVWKPLKMDSHPELIEMYFGNYEKLVYQAQTDDPELTRRAQDCAKRLNLTFERRFTGYGELATTLNDWAERSTG